MRFSTVRFVIAGQSQALMFVNSGGETAETAMASEDPGYDRLDDELARLMPGVTVARGYTYASATPIFTEMFDGGTGVLTGNPAFWNATGNAYETLGTNVRDACLSGASGAALCVLVHYWHGQDLSSQFWTEPLWRDGLAAFYAKLNTDIAGSWGEFRILPVLTASRPNISGNALTISRRIWKTMAGRDDYVGVSRVPYVLPPAECPGVTVNGALSGSDFTHITRGAAWRNADHIAARIAGLNGFNPPQPDYPRLYDAEKLTSTTLRAYVSLPGKSELKNGGMTAGFSIGGVSCTATGIDNSQASQGRAIVSLTAGGAIQPGDRLRFATGAAASYFSGGNLLAWFEDPIGITITDDCEDVLDSGTDRALFVAHEDRGVAIRGA